VLIMTGENKRYPVEFKEYVAKLIEKDGRKLIDVSQELHIPYRTIQKWLNKYRQKLREAEKNNQSQLLTASEYKELYEAELRSKLELQEENEILKKAMHIFTQEQK
jgi:transposase